MSTATLPASSPLTHAMAAAQPSDAALSWGQRREALKRMPGFMSIAMAHGQLFNVEGVSILDAVRASGLDYTVATAPTFAQVAGFTGTDTLALEGWKAVLRFNTDGTRAPLGIVKTRFQAVQNLDALVFAQHLIDDHGANVCAAGAFGNPLGSRAFVALRLTDTLTIGGSDKHTLYAVVTNAHDGNAGVSARVAAVREASQSEVTIDLGRIPMKFSFRHSGDTGVKMREAIGTMGMVRTWAAQYKDASSRLLAEKFTADQFDAFTHQLLATPRGAKDKGAKDWAQRRAELTDLFLNSPTQAFARFTKYAAFTAACEYADHYGATRGGDAATIRANRVMEGRTVKFKSEAWRLLNKPA